MRWRSIASSRVTYTIVLSTASPYKFADSVLEALDDKEQPKGEPFALLHKLNEETGVEIPPRMLALEELPVLHSEVIPSDKMELAVMKNLV